MTTNFLPSDPINATRMNQLITELENLINGIKNGTTTINPDIGNMATLLDDVFGDSYDGVPVAALDPTGASSGDVPTYNGTTVIWGTTGGGSSYPLYVPVPWFFSWLPTGCLFLNGKSIGSAASGATARADADVETLFAYLWAEMDAASMDVNIQDSAGSPATLGASAAADFAAAKRLVLPDLRGRVLAGTDNMNGGSANVVTDAEADKLAGELGSETHTLTEAQLPSHTHNTLASPSSYNVDNTGGFTAPRYVSSASSATGGDEAHNNMQPTTFVNFIIRYL